MGDEREDYLEFFAIKSPRLKTAVFERGLFLFEPFS